MSRICWKRSARSICWCSGLCSRVNSRATLRPVARAVCSAPHWPLFANLCFARIHILRSPSRCTRISISSCLLFSVSVYSTSFDSWNLNLVCTVSHYVYLWLFSVIVSTLLTIRKSLSSQFGTFSYYRWDRCVACVAAGFGVHLALRNGRAAQCGVYLSAVLGARALHSATAADRSGRALVLHTLTTRALLLLETETETGDTDETPAKPDADALALLVSFWLTLLVCTVGIGKGFKNLICLLQSMYLFKLLLCPELTFSYYCYSDFHTFIWEFWQYINFLYVYYILVQYVYKYAVE